MKKMIGAAAAVLIAVAGGGYWYVHWYTKTPTYTIDEIRAAAVEHDPEAFERRVNLDRVVSSGTDDVMGFMMGDAGDAIMGTPFARDIVCAVKPAVVSGLKDTILMMVKTGTFDGTDRAQSHAQGQKDASANTIIEKSGARSIDFSGIDYVKEDDDGDKANVGIRIDEPDLGNYVLDPNYPTGYTATGDGPWNLGARHRDGEAVRPARAGRCRDEFARVSRCAVGGEENGAE